MVEIIEKIQFNKFDSKELGFYLISRDAPTPGEKELIEDLPFVQGEYDFSMLTGERIFKNRKISYVFHYFNAPYETRKNVENKTKALLMMNGQSRILDSHDKGYYWLGKCESVQVDDDESKRKLIIKIDFNCYPYLIALDSAFKDEWDTFDFEDGVAQFYKYRINGIREINLVNYGSVSTSPIITVSDPMRLTLNDSVIELKKGKNEDFFIKLSVGENLLNVTGNGTFEIDMRLEVMA
ncbi:hypothetical protein [Carnobacterium maltaromaticum]